MSVSFVGVSVICWWHQCHLLLSLLECHLLLVLLVSFVVRVSFVGALFEDDL